MSGPLTNLSFSSHIFCFFSLQFPQDFWMTLIYILRLVFCCSLLSRLEEEEGVKLIALSSPPISLYWRACRAPRLPLSLASLLEKHLSIMEIIKLYVKLLIPPHPFKKKPLLKWSPANCKGSAIYLRFYSWRYQKKPVAFIKDDGFPLFSSPPNFTWYYTSNYIFTAILKNGAVRLDTKSSNSFRTR